MRILLVDPEAVFTSGGGRQMTARAHAAELGLADVIVDARKPLIYSMTTWLQQYNNKNKKGNRELYGRQYQYCNWICGCE